MIFLNLIIKLFITNFLMVNLSHALNNEIDQTSDRNHLVIFNIDDSKKLEYTSSSYKQSFDQDSINYCNFDPLALTKKIELFDQIEREKPDFFVNVFSKTYSFNLTSEIKIRIKFMNRQADSNQLWYLLVAKNSCTNSVVGSWRLVQSATTDTIYCYNRDDTVFGHRNKKQDIIFEQIWIPNNNEDVYFVVAVFTDETYSAINPTYFLLSSPVFRFERPDSNSPCPNLISQLNSLENSSNKTAQTKAKIETTISTSTTTPELPDSTKQLYQTSNTTTSIPRSTYPTTSLALTIKAMNQKTELKNTFKKSKYKMNANLRAKINYNSSQSILVSLNGRAKLCSKRLSDKLKEGNIKAKLEEIYRNVENFERVEIVKIENFKCPLLKAKRNVNQLTDQNNLNFYIQHYILFNSPVHNSIKFSALNELRNHLTETNFDLDVEFIDGYITNENGTQIRLENSCLLYENLEICQNNGVCVLTPNGLPACSCMYLDESHFWTGNFCTIKSERSYDPDKIKLIASVTALGGFVVLSLLFLLIFALCQRKCKKKSKKCTSVLLSSSASSYLSSSTNQKLNQSYQKEPSFSGENSQSYTKLGYDSTEYMSVVGSCGQTTPPPAMLTAATIDLRYCFSARNSVVNDRSSSSASSTEIYSDLEEKRLIKPSGLVCLTDGSSTSYKVIKDKHYQQSNQVFNYPVYQLKKSSPESSNITYNASSNDTSIISNLNQTSSTSRSNSQVDEQIVNMLAYPREITIFSTPIKTKFKAKAKEKSKNVQKNFNIDHLNKSHVNYGYNMSLSDEPFYLDRQKSELKATNLTNEQTNLANVRRESSQLLPQSMEKHLVKNLQNFSVDGVSTVCSSTEYNYDNNNHYLKSREYQPVNDYNLRDEDAWVPILVLAEEQIKKYEAEKLHDSNLTESYMF